MNISDPSFKFSSLEKLFTASTASAVPAQVATIASPAGGQTKVSKPVIVASV